MQSDNMYEINNDPRLLNKYIDCNVYYENEGRFGLYKKKGVAFDPYRMKFGKHPDHLYISIHDRIGKVKNEAKRLNTKLARDIKSNPVRAKQRMSEVVAVILSEPRSEVLEDMKDTIDIIVDEYLSSPDVLKNLTRIYVKDYSTQLHLTNVMLFCLGYANEAGYNNDDMKLFGLMGLLHDVGKVDIPDEILSAPRKLSNDEFETIKKHPRRGWQMLKECNFDHTIPTCALEHHERLDGSGYPEGKKSVELSDYSKAMSIVDVYEALTTWRPYKDPMIPKQALKLMVQEVDDNKLDGHIFKEFVHCVVGLTDKNDTIQSLRYR
ncbi:MAG TPA: HD domain-containing protein [Deltaproteobacteria bacterium]|nr:HD domain-containing protein [Deltaproteobacteria bacterium]